MYKPHRADEHVRIHPQELGFMLIGIVFFETVVGTVLAANGVWLWALITSPVIAVTSFLIGIAFGRYHEREYGAPGDVRPTANDERREGGGE